MMRTIMIQQRSFIIDDYVYSIWHQRPEFAHSATWHTESRRENPLCSGNIRDSGLGFIPASRSPSVGRQETCSLTHASYHRRLDKCSAYSDLHHHNFFSTRGMCDEQNTTWWSKSRFGYQNFMAFNYVMRFSEKGMRISILAMTRSMSY